MCYYYTVINSAGCLDFMTEAVGRGKCKHGLQSVFGHAWKKDSLKIFISIICLSLESGTLDILATNLIATVGDQLTFQCLASGWYPTPDLYWTLNNTAVNKTLYNTTVVTNGSVSNLNSSLKLTAVNNVSVGCNANIPALPSPLQKSVYLLVRKKCFCFNNLMRINFCICINQKRFRII